MDFRHPFGVLIEQVLHFEIALNEGAHSFNKFSDFLRKVVFFAVQQANGAKGRAVRVAHGKAQVGHHVASQVGIMVPLGGLQRVRNLQSLLRPDDVLAVEPGVGQAGRFARPVGIALGAAGNQHGEGVVPQTHDEAHGHLGDMGNEVDDPLPFRQKLCGQSLVHGAVPASRVCKTFELRMISRKYSTRQDRSAARRSGTGGCASRRVMEQITFENMSSQSLRHAHSGAYPRKDIALLSSSAAPASQQLQLCLCLYGGRLLPQPPGHCSAAMPWMCRLP